MFKKTNAFKYYKKQIQKNINLGHNEMGIEDNEHRYSDMIG